jgi:hypothetical protein
MKMQSLSGALRFDSYFQFLLAAFYQYNLKKTYKSRFEKIINKQKEPNSVPADSNPKPTETQQKIKKALVSPKN